VLFSTVFYEVVRWRISNALKRQMTIEWRKFRWRHGLS